LADAHFDVGDHAREKVELVDAFLAAETASQRWAHLSQLRRASRFIQHHQAVIPLVTLNIFKWRLFNLDLYGFLVFKNVAHSRLLLRRA